MRDQPQRRRPFVARARYAHQSTDLGCLHFRQEPDTGPLRNGAPLCVHVTTTKGDASFWHSIAQPAHEGRARIRVVGADEPMARKLGLTRRPTVPGDVCLAGEKRHALFQQRLHDVVGLLGRRPCAHRHMSLAVFQPEQTISGQVTHHDIGILGLKFRQHRNQQMTEPPDRGHHQVPGHRVAAPAQAPLEL